MKKISAIFLSIFFQAGGVFLPMGGFSVLTSLPQMYNHCQGEDKDMTPFDFVTDHLMNIDGLFDKHDAGDDQKPHEALPFQKTQHHTPVFCFGVFIITLEPIKRPFNAINISRYNVKKPIQEFFTAVFRPPIKIV